MFPSSVVVKKNRDRVLNYRKLGNMKTIRFGVLGRDAVGFEGQAIVVHT